MNFYSTIAFKSYTTNLNVFISCETKGKSQKQWQRLSFVGPNRRAETLQVIVPRECSGEVQNCKRLVTVVVESGWSKEVGTSCGGGVFVIQCKIHVFNVTQEHTIVSVNNHMHAHCCIILASSPCTIENYNFKNIVCIYTSTTQDGRIILSTHTTINK